MGHSCDAVRYSTDYTLNNIEHTWETGLSHSVFSLLTADQSAVRETILRARLPNILMKDLCG